MKTFNSVNQIIFVNNDKGETKMVAQAESPECAAHISKCLGLHNELVEFIQNLENDDKSIPDKIWQWRNDLLKRAKE